MAWVKNYCENSVLFGFLTHSKNPAWRNSLLETFVYAPIKSPALKWVTKFFTFIPFAFLNDFFIAPIVSFFYNNSNLNAKSVNLKTQGTSLKKQDPDKHRNTALHVAFGATTKPSNQNFIDTFMETLTKNPTDLDSINILNTKNNNDQTPLDFIASYYENGYARSPVKNIASNWAEQLINALNQNPTALADLFKNISDNSFNAFFECGSDTIIQKIINLSIEDGTLFDRLIKNNILGSLFANKKTTIIKELLTKLQSHPEKCRDLLKSKTSHSFNGYTYLHIPVLIEFINPFMPDLLQIIINTLKSEDITSLLNEKIGQSTSLLEVLSYREQYREQLNDTRYSEGLAMLLNATPEPTNPPPTYESHHFKTTPAVVQQFGVPTVTPDTTATHSETLGSKAKLS